MRSFKKLDYHQVSPYSSQMKPEGVIMIIRSNQRIKTMHLDQIISGGSPGVGNGNLLQYSCLGNPMDTEAWWVTVHGATESQTWLRD